MKTVKRFHKKPENSIIDRDMSGDSHYVDSFSVKCKNSKHYSIDYLTASLFSSIPVWVRMLLNLRDFLVKPFGLETGIIPEQEALDTSLHYNIGDRAIFFPVIDRSECEIVMAEDDKHLYFRTSLYIENTIATKFSWIEASSNPLLLYGRSAPADSTGLIEVGSRAEVFRCRWLI